MKVKLRYAQLVLTSSASTQDSNSSQTPKAAATDAPFGGMQIEFESQSSAPLTAPVATFNPAIELLRSLGPIVLVLLVASVLVRVWSKRSASRAARRNPQRKSWLRSTSARSASQEPSADEPMNAPLRCFPSVTEAEDALRALREKAS